jgi:RNA polymerase sigma-70 factor (ECF subfamily)
MNSFLRLLREEGSRDAYTHIYNHYADQLYRHALVRVKDTVIAEEILQELFIQFWDRRASLNDQIDLDKYLYSAIKYKIIDHFNRLKTHSTKLNELAQHLKTHAEQNPDYLKTYLALEKIVELELEKMSKNMREILLLRWEKYSIPCIAEKLQLSEQTVKNNLTTAKRRLKRKIDENSENLDIILISQISFALIGNL